MSDKSVRRREFLKMMGIGAVGIGTAPVVLAQTEEGTVVSSSDEYGNFAVEKLSTNYYKSQPDVLKPMQNKMTVFSRNFWDPVRGERPLENVMYKNLVKGKGVIPNQTRLDYALNNGAWTFADFNGIYEWKRPAESGPMSTPWKPEEIDMDWEDTSVAVKHAGLFYGASLAGIAELNPLWLYTDINNGTRENRERTIPVIRDTDRFEQTEDANYIPHTMNRVIALVFEEDFDSISNSPGRLASAAVGNGYSRMAFTAGCLAEFIRNLGYNALPSGNDTALSIPIAIDAGLGELGRNGLLVTPKFGPRVRIAKVITDMPLIPDQPIRFGVKEFCDACMLCADDCPSGSISKSKPTWKGTSASNSHGVLKWYISPESCFDYNGFSCSNCKRVCPFTKPNNSWLHQMIRKIIQTKINPLNDVMVKMDQASGYGHQTSDIEFWKKTGDRSITARDVD